MTEARRPIRIANASGFFGDRMSAIAEVANGGPVDVITGDYLAEVTMSILGKMRRKNPELGYAPTFLMQLAPAVPALLQNGTKVVVNAGGLNPEGLAKVLREKSGGMAKVATVAGDDLVTRLEALRESNGGFPSLESGHPLPPAEGFVHTANAYLGAWGIVRALQEGADIVICARVTDASLVVGPAAWWHGWSRTDYARLAGAVAAGHVIECGPQATGGNYSGFKSIANLAHPAFPLAEVAADGSSVITKHPGSAGAVTVGTVTAQLVYEVSGPRYLNPDVVTRLDTIQLSEEGEDRVAIRGVQGEPPPPTTKVAITTKGGFRNEMTLCFVGLDIDEKIALFEKETRAVSKATLKFERIGVARENAAIQEEATVLLRVVATSDDEQAVSRAFSSAIIEQGLSSYPGLFATGLPGPAHEATGYWPTLVKQSDLEHAVTHHDGRVERVDVPPDMRPTPRDESMEATAPVSGDFVVAPLGRIADARSGDKGSDANVGLWVATEDAFTWLTSALSIDKLRELLPEAQALRIDRYEFPHLRAVNFVIHDLLAGGAVATLRFDRQAKALGEFLRSRHIAIPRSLLAAAPAPPAPPAPLRPLRPLRRDEINDHRALEIAVPSRDGEVDVARPARPEAGEQAEPRHRARDRGQSAGAEVAQEPAPRHAKRQRVPSPRSVSSGITPSQNA
ncbi:MAG: acyclic terpene utilization AtuA family protein [Labilithrix sp.]